MTRATAGGAESSATTPARGDDAQRTPPADLLHVNVPGKPRPQGSTDLYVNRATGRAGMKKRPGEVEHRTVLALELRSKAPWVRWPMGWTGPVVVELRFHFARPKSHKAGNYPTDHTYKPDIDKLTRLALDAITQSGVIHDDSQVIHVRASKRWADEDATDIQIYRNTSQEEGAQ